MNTEEYKVGRSGERECNKKDNGGQSAKNTRYINAVMKPIIMYN